jgi:catechol 2,3-dioxygenase-like lactoylglutathione lyase family enzyme
MITKLSHVTLFVTNQEAAKEFYVGKLGFKVHTDQTMDHGFRWLTVVAPAQPDLEIVLLEPQEGPMMDAEAAAALRLLLGKGILGAGAFETPDCKQTYETLRAKGVHFAGAPEERFYGTEAIMKDGVGNWFSVTTHKPH